MITSRADSTLDSRNAVTVRLTGAQCTRAADIASFNCELRSVDLWVRQELHDCTLPAQFLTHKFILLSTINSVDPVRLLCFNYSVDRAS